MNEIANTMSILMGEDVKGYKLNEMVKEVDFSENGTVTLPELEEVSYVREIV